MSDAAETLARRWFDEVWTQRRRASIHELMTADAVGHSPTGDTRGPGEWERAWETLTGAFPDIAVRVEQTISDGRNCVVRWTARLTHTGGHLGFPASGRPATAQGLTWIVVENGRIVEGWDGWDSTGLLAAVGGATLHPALAKARASE